MNKKALISLVLVFAMCICFAACGSGAPSGEPVSESSALQVVNPRGETYTENEDDEDVLYKSTVSNVQFEYPSYLKYENNYASVKNIVIDEDSYTVNANGYIDFDIISIKNKSKDIKIGYTAYDADGDVVRKTYMLIKLDGVKEGDTVESIRFDFPYNAVKVVFYDYVEAE